MQFSYLNSNLKPKNMPKVIFEKVEKNDWDLGDTEKLLLILLT